MAVEANYEFMNVLIKNQFYDDVNNLNINIYTPITFRMLIMKKKEIHVVAIKHYSMDSTYFLNVFEKNCL